MTKRAVDRPLATRHAVVTGASSGIGRAIALRLAAEGAGVTAVGRDPQRLASLTGAPGRIIPVQADLTDDVARSALVSRLSSGARVDLLVHSAGAYRRAGHTETAVDDLDVLYATNVRAPYALTMGLLPMLRAGGGDVVVINSTILARTDGDVGLYAATQHAMRSIADSLRVAVNADGVRVCTLHLGRTATPLQAEIFRQEGRPYPAESLLQPEDVADAVVDVVTLSARAEATEIHLRPAEKCY
ncbi:MULTISPECIES: SDR family oxidoreductase [Mycolicibacter]|uniref:SDR family NAD(P)-dependent oxidoreductase n=1 Tax=[Mycobacterium] vasticus TaxID=2875777 RepID=A0ABU5YS89_9MYCO|nr:MULTISPECIES: SDR family NAD(P)-dependent oxidoreductase [unclassified Mycolicibacter]MEB3061531.1 SDR family NAD(P)-dependent oxidoreductase [Mycolicibacter sp. MYC101]MEB3067790.1 SDR family NAD(P)-dependent oxidoreductase [Mycolicibacter sp. MYC017]